MPKVEIAAFSDDHIDDAAELLAARHARHRRAEGLLPEQYEGAAAARDAVVAAWRADAASGSVALRDGHVAGYLIGAPRDPTVWGENVWIEHAGHAVDEAELVRDLYAVAARRWYSDEGRARQYALVPAHDAELVDAWFRLGFGHQQAHAVQEVGPRDVAVPDGFEIREPTADEVDALLEVDIALPRHQREAPVFSNRPLPTEREQRDEWADSLARTDEDILVGYRAGRPVACWSVSSGEPSSHHAGLGWPDRSSYLGFAVTLPEARGSGIGVALTDMSIARAAEHGCVAMVTDWRVTNLLASRFWPRRGFRTTFLRLYRSIP